MKSGSRQEYTPPNPSIATTRIDMGIKQTDPAAILSYKSLPSGDVRTRRVAFFLAGDAGGGIERFQLLLAGAFVEKGIAVDIVVDNHRLIRMPFLAELRQKVRDLALNLHVVDLDATSMLITLWRLASYLRRRRPAALLSAWDPNNCVAVLARTLARVDTNVVVVEEITPTASWPGLVTLGGRYRWLPRLVRWTYPRAFAVVGVSKGVADDLAHAARMKRDRIHVIPNVFGTDLAHRASEPLDHPWLQPGALPVILGAGRLVPQKDFSNLLRAFARVRSQLDGKCRLMILGAGGGETPGVGSSEEQGKLEDLIRELQIEEDVELVGFASNPYQYMSRATVFVLSSKWEGLPTVLIEAMACGTPVVSTDCPHGPREILEDGKWGRLVPVGSDEELAEAILDALRSPGADPRRRAEDFSLERCANRYLELLFPEGVIVR